MVGAGSKSCDRSFTRSVNLHKPTRRVCFRKKRGARRSRAAAALGKLFDVLGAGRLGDVATADGDGGHATRHFLINTSIYDALHRVNGFKHY